MVAVIKLSVPINEVTIFNDRQNDGALLDSGASEVVRPYISGWHQDIKAGRCRGREVPIRLAGGVEKIGVITGTGEVMIPKKRGEFQGWILPVIRIVEELGGEVTWDLKELKIQFPEGRVVKVVARGDGLRYVKRLDLKWIRKGLVKSHCRGRPLARKITKMAWGKNIEKCMTYHTRPEDKDEKFQERKMKAQIEVGTLMWLTIRTRPDLCQIVGVAASNITHNPAETIRMCQSIRGQLAKHHNLGMKDMIFPRRTWDRRAALKGRQG